MKKKIIIFSAGSAGREVFQLISIINKLNKKWEVVGYVDSDPKKVGKTIDGVKPNKKYRKPDEKEKIALQNLVKRLNDCNDQMDPEAIQTIVYSVGKENGYKENLREWFKAIYEIIFGDQDGPRMGFFISFFGIKETIELINKRIK